MARTKVRKYPSTGYVREMINRYFNENRDVVLADLLEKTSFADMNELRDAERRSYFGFDCGWVYLETANPEQYREWVLDNGKYDAKVGRLDYPFNCQSVTCKEIQLDKAIKDLGLTGNYYSASRLD